MPNFYEHLMLAKWLGVSPWDLVGLPPLPIFRIWASKALECEHRARMELKQMEAQTVPATADASTGTMIPWPRR